MTPQTIVYSGQSLQTSSILTAEIPHEQMPEVDAKAYAFANDNASSIPDVYYPNKVFSISGKITGTSITNTDSNLATFKSYIALGAAGIAQPLVIGWNGTTLQYYATVTKVDIKRPGNLMYATFNVEFTCTKPWGFFPSTSTAWTDTAFTTLPQSSTYTFLGTAPYQLPVATITLTAVTDTSGGWLVFGNSSTGQAIWVNRTWANGDVCVIDSTQKTVTVNGVPTDFAGAFPKFPPGSQTMYYSDNFTSRTASVSVVYTEAIV